MKIKLDEICDDGLEEYLLSQDGIFKCKHRNLVFYK